jgi:hypothetical protein
MGQQGKAIGKTGWLIVNALLFGVLIGVGLDRAFVPAVVLAAENPAKNIIAQNFIVEDQKGSKRASFGWDGDGTALVMFDAKGVRRLGIGLDPKGTGLNLFDASGKVIRVSLHLRADGVSGITFYDHLGVPKAGISVDAAGAPASP